MIASAVLKGLRVLIVEDSFMVAMALAQALEQLGCKVVGPVASARAGVQLVDDGECDAAVLDINLGDHSSEQVARRLCELKLPFVFVTGYGSPSALGPQFRSWPRMNKPFAPEVIQQVLVNAVQQRIP